MTFDRIAPFYPLAEQFLAGGRVQRARSFHATAALAGCRRILISGDGHGPGLEMVLRTVPHARITVVESCAAMIPIARDRVRRLGLHARGVTWVHEDLREWKPARGGFDAVIAQFFLDCFAPDDLQRVVRRLSRAADRRASFLVCDFRIPSRGWKRLRAALIHRVLYRLFRSLTGLEATELTPPEPFLGTEGFVLRRRALFCGGLIHSDHWVRGGDSGPPGGAGRVERIGETTA